MIYLYTAPDCPKCDSRKKDLKANSIEYIERDANRLKRPADDYDDIDKDAIVQLAMQNQILPAEVER
jgi:glutaredoxin